MTTQPQCNEEELHKAKLCLNTLIKVTGITPKLQPGFKTDWLKALHSGTYRQRRNHLQKGGAYCCLGVGCIVLGTRPIGTDGRTFSSRPDWDMEAAWDCDDSAGRRTESLLATMNDNGADFPTIANFIEERL